MKVIKQGKIPSNQFRGECLYCHTVAEAHKSELTIIDSVRNESLASAKCTLCGRTFHLYPIGEEESLR